jgi:hypothetical protein
MGMSKKLLIPRPDIPSGKYVLRYLDHWTFNDNYANRTALKLVILFQIIEGDYAGAEIARIYNVKKASGKRPFNAFAQGALWTEFCVVMEGHLNTRNLRRDELPINKMKGLRIKAKVRATKKNRDGVGLVGGAAYSVVRNLIGSEPGKETERIDTPIPFHAEPLPSPTPSLTPIPTPSGLAGESYSAKATEKGMGKNGGINGESTDSEDNGSFPLNKMRWDD